MNSPAIPNLLLPIETVNRELDAKLLLGLFAAEAGFNCHIGTMNKILSSGFPPSIYMSKSVRFAKQVKLMRQLGHTVAAWDEEGLVRFRDDIHAARLEEDAFNLPSALFSWGKSNSEVWRKHPFYCGTKIIEAGNPRIDLLRDELRPLHLEKAESLRTAYGPFAMFNTNFSFVNHYKVGGRPAKVGRNSYDGKAYLKFKREVDDHKRRLFDEFKLLMPKLAEVIAPAKLIIRPHPSENPETWRGVAAHLPNVVVIHEGQVAPWLLAASCLIHNGCTSAVEASVLRRPVLAYCPIEDERYDFILPNALSEKFASADAICRRAREILSQGTLVRSPEHAYPAILKENLSALDGPFSSERIVSALLEMKPADARSARIAVKSIALLKLGWRFLKKMIDSEGGRYDRHKANEEEFSVARISARARKFGEVLNRFEDLTFVQRCPGIVTIAASS
jgi:surface carbohydrate biosynthesis protein